MYRAWKPMEGYEVFEGCIFRKLIRYLLVIWCNEVLSQAVVCIFRGVRLPTLAKPSWTSQDYNTKAQQ